MRENLPKVYFSGINEIRFIAAVIVFVVHLELIKSQFGFVSLFTNEYGSHFGNLALDIFFVLGGFLITYILFVEKELTQSISLPKFYLRRCLRILPLYFLLIVLSFFIIPRLNFLDIPYLSENVNEHFWFKFLLFIFMLPNVAFVILKSVSYVSVLWFVGVEEQFYLVWPWFVKYSKNYVRLLFAILLFFCLSKILTSYQLAHSTWKYWIYVSFFLDKMSRISCMAIGGLGAFLIHKNYSKALEFLFKKPVQIIVLLLFLFLFFFEIKEAVYLFLKHEIISVLICVLIMNVAHNPNNLIKINLKLFDKLGKVTYGIYLLHLIAIVGCMYLLKDVFLEGKVWMGNLLLYGLSFSITLLLAFISYHFYEVHFIRLKSKFSKILSGDAAR